MMNDEFLKPQHFCKILIINKLYLQGILLRRLVLYC